MGKIDVIIGMWKGERRDKAYALSKPYHENEIVLIAKQEDTVDFQDLHSIGDQDVGVGSDARYAPMIENSLYLNRVFEPSDRIILTMLTKDRFKFGIGDKLVIVELTSSEELLSNSLRIVSPLTDSLPLQVAILKTLPDHLDDLRGV